MIFVFVCSQAPAPPAEPVEPKPNYLKWGFIIAAALIGNWALTNTAAGLQFTAVVQGVVDAVKAQVPGEGGEDHPELSQRMSNKNKAVNIILHSMHVIWARRVSSICYRKLSYD